MEKILGSIYVRWSIFYEMHHSVCTIERKHEVVIDEEWYGRESLSYKMSNAYLLRSNPAVDFITARAA